jgi:hypothetical protein
VRRRRLRADRGTSSSAAIVNDRADRIKAAARTTTPAPPKLPRIEHHERERAGPVPWCSSLDTVVPVDEAARTTSKAGERARNAAQVGGSSKVIVIQLR